MAKLIAVLRKHTWEDWNIADWPNNPLSVFTQEEYDKIVVPYLSYMRSLPGLAVDDIQYIKDGNEHVTIRTFDTVENAKIAQAALTYETAPQVVRSMTILLKAKQQERGYDYSRELKLLP